MFEFYLILKKIYVFTVCLCFLVSLVSFVWNYPKHLKIFSVLLGITAFTEVIATRMLISFFTWTKDIVPVHEIPARQMLTPILFIKPNSPVYNSFTIVEFMAYAFFYWQIVETKWIRNGIKIFLFLFPFFWFLMVFVVKQFSEWNSYVSIGGGIFTVGFALGYYHHLLHSSKITTIKKRPEFWIATGMLINYACQIPYWGVLDFLYKSYPNITTPLGCVSFIMNISMYIVFIYSFLCNRSIQTKSL